MARYTTSGEKSIISAINTELGKIATSQQDFLSRNGEAPNQMEADLDMNGNRILNHPAPAAPTDLVRLVDLTSNSGDTRTFSSLRELLNTDLSDAGIGVGEYLQCLGRVERGDGGGRTYLTVATGGSIDYETLIPITDNLNAELISGTRSVLSNSILEVVAHRGFTGFNVEGSMYAFSSAIAYGADALECDIQVTSDGELVLFHDEDTTEDLLNNITGTIAQNTYAQTQAATYKELAGNVLENKVRLAKFGELLDYVALVGCRLHAEIKVFRTESDIDLMINEIVSRDLEDSVLLHSFRLSDIQYVRAANKRIKVALLITNLTGNDRGGVPIQTGIDWIKRDKNAMATMSLVAIDFEEDGYATVESLQEAGVEVAAWTAENGIDFLFARRNNVNVVISDYPYAYSKFTRKNNVTYF